MSFVVPKATSMDESLGCCNARMGFSYSLSDSVMPVAPLYLLGRTHGISSVGDPMCLECHACFCEQNDTSSSYDLLTAIHITFCSVWSASKSFKTGHISIFRMK